MPTPPALRLAIMAACLLITGYLIAGAFCAALTLLRWLL